MDERTLNDLLECSVCLERLDTSSKVLPCQHTFCRKCLEVIFNSRQELRCPECRVLVDIKIDELPPNVLLMRILGGLKNATQNQNNSTKSPKIQHQLTTIAQLQNSNNLNSINSINNTETRENNCKKIFKNDLQQQAAQQPQPQIRASSNEQNNRRILPHAFALYDFISKESGDLNFKKGDIILLKRKIDPNWFVGEINGREGAFPINYVQVIVPLPVPQCIALYDFKMGPNEEEGCLTFKKSTVINVLRRVDHNWAEGRIGTQIGIFPIAFVEMNSLAKQIVETGAILPFIAPRCLPPVPEDNSDTSTTTTTATTSPISTCSSDTTTNSTPSSPTNNLSTPISQSATKRHGDIKEKRHSLIAITANNRLSIVQSNRHSAEILTVPESIATNDTENGIAQPGGSGQSNSTHQGTSRQPENKQTQHTTRANVLKTNGHNHVPNLPWAYIALYPYKPRKSDELELKKGCVYFVTERCLDGWYKGRNWADKSGVFPGNYVIPLKNRDQQQIIHQRKISQGTQSYGNAPPNSGQSHDYMNSTSLQQNSMHPPELPPRSTPAVPSNSASVWTKPLGQQVEAFFNRKPQNGSQQTTGNGTKDATVSANSAVSLMKRLTNMKRSKSPTQMLNNYSMDNPVFEDSSIAMAVTPGTKHNHNISLSHPVHVRSGSCPSQLLQNLPYDVAGGTITNVDQHGVFGSQRIKGHKERPSLHGIRQKAHEVANAQISASTNISTSTVANFMSKSASATTSHKQNHTTNSVSCGTSSNQHRKSQSLDANTISSQLSGNSPATVAGGLGKSHGTQHVRERFRCIVPYPPNSDVELDLSIGDVVFVHRKQKNGWYKGTHSRTNKTGLFPASFVEPDI